MLNKKSGFTWNKFSGQARRDMKKKYTKVLESTGDYSHRLRGFATNTHTPAGISSTLGDVSHPLTVHRDSLLEASKTTVYLNNNSWLPPHMSKIVTSDIAEYFHGMPSTIMQEFHKGAGSDIVEAALLSHFFNTKGSFTQIIALGQAAMDGTRVKNFYNLDGTPSKLKDPGKRMRKGLSVLDEKHRHIKGISKMLDDSNPVNKTATILFGPTTAKIAFGTNLTAATVIVEGGMNWADQLLRPTNLRSAISSITAPLWNLDRRTEMREVASDLLHITEALTHSYIADYESSIGTDTNKLVRVLEKGFKGWGKLNIAFAHHALKGITYSRVIGMRRYVRKNIGKMEQLSVTLERVVSVFKKVQDGVSLENLTKKEVDTYNRYKKYTIDKATGKTIVVRDINTLDKRLPTMTSKMFFKICRDTGIGRNNREIPRYLLRAGLLEVSRFAYLKDAIGQGDAKIGNLNPDNDSVYKIDKMRVQLELITPAAESSGKGKPLTTRAQNPEYQERISVLQGLRQIERLYIEDVILNPNAFDMYTGEGTGWQLWEVYMRYPTIFAANAVLRRMGRQHPMRAVTGLLLASFLDTIYMAVLGLAYPGGIERFMRDYRNGEYHFERLARLPALGRYASMVADTTLHLLNDIRFGEGYQGQRRPIQPVGVPAGIQVVTKMMKGLLGGGSGVSKQVKSWAADDPNVKKGWASAAKTSFEKALEEIMPICPGVGDITLRIIYQIWKGSRSSQGVMPGYGSADEGMEEIRSFFAQYGEDQEEAMESLLRTENLDLDMDGLFAKLFEELGLHATGDPTYFDRQAAEHKAKRNAPTAEAVGQPTEEAPAPAPVAKPVNTQSLISKMTSGSKASSKLADLIT
jgi:hypothetical protein